MTGKKKNALILIGISLALIFLGYLGSMNSEEYYNSLILPSLAPPSIVFPIAWGIIYTLMVAGAVIIEVFTHNLPEKKEALSAYFVQLVLNIIWPYLFFTFKMPVASFIWIIILFIAVLVTFRKFYKLNRLAGIMYIPYLIWLVYAGYINLGVAILN